MLLGFFFESLLFFLPICQSTLVSSYKRSIKKSESFFVVQFYFYYFLLLHLIFSSFQVL